MFSPLSEVQQYIQIRLCAVTTLVLSTQNTNVRILTVKSIQT